MLKEIINKIKNLPPSLVGDFLNEIDYMYGIPDIFAECEYVWEYELFEDYEGGLWVFKRDYKDLTKNIF